MRKVMLDFILQNADGDSRVSRIQHFNYCIFVQGFEVTVENQEYIVATAVYFAVTVENSEMVFATVVF